MLNRRRFLQISSLGLGSFSFSQNMFAGIIPDEHKHKGPIVLSTWNHGQIANKGAWEVLSKGGRALDAVEAGVKLIESDFTNRSVGLGGYPDRDGFTTLDACIMDEHGNAGSVAFLQNIENPISVARRVMENTPHVMLVGDGAYQYAIQQGFPKKEVKLDEVKQAWERWKKESKYVPKANIENHDTIGMIALDANGNLSGSCTTSGMAWKIHGRVGDSPIIGAGLFVDNEIGAACATGVGEYVIRTCGSHLVVELMRQGYSPAKACKLAVERILHKHRDVSSNIQVGFLALNKKGEYGGYALQYGFDYAVRNANLDKLIDAGHHYPKPPKTD